MYCRSLGCLFHSPIFVKFFDYALHLSRYCCSSRALCFSQLPVRMSNSYMGICSLSQQLVPPVRILGLTRWFFLLQFGYRRLCVACALLILNCLDCRICFISPEKKLSLSYPVLLPFLSHQLFLILLPGIAS